MLVIHLSDSTIHPSFYEVDHKSSSYLGGSVRSNVQDHEKDVKIRSQPCGNKKTNYVGNHIFIYLVFRQYFVLLLD